jgi:hypothetical protein
MGIWKVVYLASLLLLAIVISVSFGYAAYNTVTSVNAINTQATNETLIKLPPTENFLGPAISSAKTEDANAADYNSSKTEKQKKDDYARLSNWQKFKFNLTTDFNLIATSIPMILLIATAFMILTIFSAFMLRSRLVAVDESKRNFESLMEAIFGYGAFVLGIVFSWSNYTTLYASVNSRSSNTAFTYDAGRAIADQVVSSLSVGLIVAFFGVALCIYAVVRGFQIYRRLDSREAVYTYRSTAPFARQHAR